MEATPLLATKFFIPPPGSDWIKREALIGHLNHARPGQVVLLSAPPGYGKTSLLSAWASQSGMPIAWVSLDQGDDDPCRFLAYLSAAVQARLVSAQGSPPASCQMPSSAAMEHVLTVLINDIVATGEPLAIILDDYHLINNPAVDQAVAFLLDHLPPQLSIIISTRNDPSLPLARLRAKNNLMEIRFDDLRFSLAETKTFLNQVLSFSLSEEQNVALHRKTEGWIAALRLAALSLQRTHDVTGFIESFSGSSRQIADYLLDEVFNKQTADLQSFLIQTSILDRLSGPLCDTVTQRDDSQEILDDLADNNLFLSALDQERAWFRYHGLFADLLRARLEQEHTDSPSLHQRASTWFSSQGLFDQAISHALAASNPDGAAALLDRHAGDLWSQGEFTTLIKWVEELPDKVLDGRLRLAVYYAVALVMTGDVQAGKSRLGRLEDHLNEIESKDAVGFLYAGTTYLAYYRRDVPKMIHYANQALASLPADNHLWRGGISVVLGNAYTHKGEIAAAHRAFKSALYSGQTEDNDFLALTASLHYAITNITQGNLHQAIEICRQQLAKEALRQIPATGTLMAVWGDVLREWNQLEAAEERIRQGHELCQQSRGIAMQGWSDLAMIKLHLSRGDDEALEDAIKGLENLVYQSEAPAWLQVALTTQKIRSRLNRQNLTGAIRLLDECNLNMPEEPSFLQLDLFISASRVDLARYALRDDRAALASAIDLLQRLQRRTEQKGWFQQHLQVLILLALAYHHQREDENAMITLDRALALAETQGYVRMFLDEGMPMLELLGQAQNRKDISRYAAKLCAAAGTNTLPDEAVASPLSERELEILILIAQGLSNAEIAQRLYITTGTVKVHASNIYSKLGVKGRIEAVNWARELGLISSGPC
jgi:LuxR family maltose regulon positive regulatory protein